MLTTAWRMMVPVSLFRIAIVAVLAIGVAIVPGATATHAQDDAPSLTVVSPSSGEPVTGDTIEVEVEVENFTIDCSGSGLADVDGVGHIHVMVDGDTMANLIGFFCDTSFSVSGAGLEPGMHSLLIMLSTNSHLPLMDSMQMVEFNYQPEDPIALPDANFTGTPGVELVSPLDGETVSSVFTVEVTGVNFIATGDLAGKTNVPGYGHWHVFVDTDMSGMDDMSSDDEEMASEDEEMSDDDSTGSDEGMSEDDDEMSDDDSMDGMMQPMAMFGLVGMPGSVTIELDLSAWGPGEHTIWIEPVQNDHTQYEEFGWIEFTITVEE